MKSFSVLLTLISLIAIVYSVPVPGNGMVFYRMPYYTQPRHQAMLVHYSQPYQAQPEQSSGVATFTSGDTIASGSYVRDCINPCAEVRESKTVEDDYQIPLQTSDGNSAVSIAEAYPADEQVPVADQEVPIFAAGRFDDSNIDELEQPTTILPIEESFNEVEPVVQESTSIEPDLSVQPIVPPKKKTAREYVPPLVAIEPKISITADIPVPISPPVADTKVDIPLLNTEAELAPNVPVTNGNRKKKVRIELETPPQPAIPEEDEEENDILPSFQTKAQRPQSNKPSSVGSNQYPWPVNTFFPVNFGSTSGGAIAVANSFSTGKGGSATSHAIAYGSSSGQRSKTGKRLVEEK